MDETQYLAQTVDSICAHWCDWPVVVYLYAGQEHGLPGCGFYSFSDQKGGRRSWTNKR